jgi:hypothetical protein
MADLGTDLFTLLSANADVKALLGASSAIYPNIAPPGAAAPYVVWNVISSVPETTHDNEPAGIDTVVLQFSCIGTTAKEARTVRKTIRAALDGAVLASGQPTIPEGEHDIFDQAVDAYHAVLEVRTFADALAA